MEISKLLKRNSSKNKARKWLLARKSVLVSAAVLLGAFFVSGKPGFGGDLDVPRRVLNRSWEVLEQGLHYKDSVVREQAIKGIEFIEGSKALDALTAALRDESEYVQIYAARELKRKGSDQGKATLLYLLSKQPEGAKDAQGPLATLLKMKALAVGRIRREAAIALSEFNSRDVIAALKQAKRDEDGRVRDGAAIALARLGDRSETVVFISAIKDEDPGVRLATIEALSAIEDPNTASVISEALTDEDERVRAEAALALGKLKDLESAKSLSAHLQDPSGVVRENSAWALGEIGDKGQIPALIASLKDPNPFVQLAGAEALGKMGDEAGLVKVEERLTANDIDARARAASTLGFIETKASQNLAIKTLEDGNIRTRLGAAISLFRMNNEEN